MPQVGPHQDSGNLGEGVILFSRSHQPPAPVRTEFSVGTTSPSCSGCLHSTAGLSERKIEPVFIVPTKEKSHACIGLERRLQSCGCIHTAGSNGSPWSFLHFCFQLLGMLSHPSFSSQHPQGIFPEMLPSLRETPDVRY